MSVGWCKRLMIEHITRKIIDETLINVDRALQDNPHLTIEEALKVIDKKRCIFFPGEQDHPSDLKSLFSVIVWKAYRYRRFSDPVAASLDHRHVVFQTVYRHLNRETVHAAKPLQNSESMEKLKFKRSKWKIIWAAGGVIIGIAGIVILWNQIELKILNIAGSKDAVILHHENIQYNGYIATERDVSALINKNIYRTGDYLGPDDQYLLKGIYPKHIVIQHQKDKTDFMVRIRRK